MSAPHVPSLNASPDLLAAIVEGVRHELRVSERRRPRGRLDADAAEREPRGDAFRAGLVAEDRINVIAECKRRSPSRGILRREYVPSAIAQGYDSAGAAAISVLTEPAFFDGDLEHLEQVRDVVDLPVLRKDFIVTEYQLVEARAAGADAALLIVAALDDVELRSLLNVARSLGLAALVEVHDERQLVRALEAEAEVIGVNNRNLRTLEVDLDASFELVSQIPDSVVAVAESGIRSSADLVTLRSVGYDAFLVGEALMSQANPGAELRTMLQGAGQVARPRRQDH